MNATPNPHHRRITPKPVPGWSVVRYHLTDENGRCKPACSEDHPAGECGEDRLADARRRWPGVPYVPSRQRSR